MYLPSRQFGFDSVKQMIIDKTKLDTFFINNILKVTLRFSKIYC